MKLATIFLSLLPALSLAQDILPPALPWDGRSQRLIVDSSHPWVTPAELSDFVHTPDDSTTMAWLEKLVQASPYLHMTAIGTSEQNRAISMVIASKDHAFSPEALTLSAKPVILVQAGIHAGEIDGKDAGMMLLRDIAFGDKLSLLDGCHLLFVPILNVDGHERKSRYNRPNQRGPEEMGWRGNACNLNLNRDYTKLETAGIRAMVKVIREYDPELYVDIHVTDGADYRYDITYGYVSSGGYSPAISSWLNTCYRPQVDAALRSEGHIPGPLLFAYNGKDFSEGNMEYSFSPRFSHAYGDARHLPAVLVENHSLKPWRQRVLGTYVFLEHTLKAVSDYYAALHSAILSDKRSRPDSLALTFRIREPYTDTLDFQGIISEKSISKYTGGEYVQWTGRPVDQKVVNITMDVPGKIIRLPAAYWIPKEWTDVIQKLMAHGILIEYIDIRHANEVVTDHYFIESYTLSQQPAEGRVRIAELTVSEKVRGTASLENAVRIPVDQPLGKLAALLLEPESPDSYFQWGYFLSVLSQTEYIEGYVMEPLIEKMLAADEALRRRFEQKKKEDPVFAGDQRSIYRWFYAQSPYFDERWKVYPVGREW